MANLKKDSRQRQVPLFPRRFWVLVGLSFAFMLISNMIQYEVSFSKSSNKNMLFIYQSFANLFSWVFVILLLGSFYALYRSQKIISVKLSQKTGSFPKVSSQPYSPSVDTLTSRVTRSEAMSTPIEIPLPQRAPARPKLNLRDKQE